MSEASKRRIRGSFAFLAAAILLLLIPACSGGRPALGKRDLVVSPDGKDQWTGRLFSPKSDGTDGPLASISEAQKRLAKSGEQNAGAVIWVRGGNYYLENELEFTADDAKDITIRAYPGEKVVFTGSEPVTGWEPDEINGVSCLSAKMDMSRKDWYFNALFSETRALPAARYPEAGYLNISAISEKDRIFTEQTAPWSLTRGDRAFYATPSELPDLGRNNEDVVVRVLHYWKDELAYLTGYDAKSGKISFGNPATMTISAGDRFFLENVPEAVNKPGEWYLDRAQGKLYYIPEEGQTPENTILYAGRKKALLKVTGAKGLTFEGITFCRTGWEAPVSPDEIGAFGIKGVDYPQAASGVDAAITVSESDNVNFVSCEFTDIGNSGILLGSNVKNSSVRSSRFENIGGNAVYIKGQNPAKEGGATSGIVITDNNIGKYGQRYFGAIGVLIIDADTCEISQNEIHDGYYTAISAGWVWGYGPSLTDKLTIKNNLIYNIGQGWLSDMGGIYTLGTQKGTVISGNVIHDVAADSGQGGYGGWGIYLDEGSSGITVEKNLVYDCGSNSFHQHYGKENLIRNNIFAFSKEAQILCTRIEEHLEFALERNIIVSAGSGPYGKIYEEGQFADNNNLFYEYTTPKILEMYKKYLKKKGYFQNAVFADPLFADPDKRDFTLSKDSPAFSIGFEVFDISAAGTLTDFKKAE